VGASEDALLCFMGTDMEVLAVGNYVLREEDQDPKLTKDYKSVFELD
jgi:carbamoyltransferase